VTTYTFGEARPEVVTTADRSAGSLAHDAADQ
jgi:hypothetical protein